MACQNLLAQMLLPSPEQRITVAEILRHPWFLRDLPPGTELVNERLQHDIHARWVALIDNPVCALRPCSGIRSVMCGISASRHGPL